MKQIASRTFSRRPICLAALVGLLTLPALGTTEPLEAQGAQMTGELPNLVGVWAVSYTHLTLPTRCSV